MSQPAATILRSKVSISMVTLKWGDFLSTLLPGALALFAVAPYFPELNNIVQNLDKAGATTGLVLLISAALAGGVLEAITRIAWEPFWLVPRCKPPDALTKLTPENLDLYERGVQSSYKHVTFYANFAWATTLLIISHVQQTRKPFSVGTLILTAAVAVLLRASHVQWKYYVNYLNKIFGPKENDAEK